jgi:plastocyanin
MRRSQRIGSGPLALVAMAATLVILLASSGCGAGTKVIVTAEGKQFNPQTITISVGTTVEWVNKDQTAHSVLSDKFHDQMPTSVGPNELASGPIEPGGTYQKTFTAPGTYKYDCMIHQYMHGVVIVR